MLNRNLKFEVRKSEKAGFTLVETLVAITILMISVAGPLAIANKSLTSALYARDQSIASFLAQEELELIKNARDNATFSSSSTFFDSTAGIARCTSTNKCDALLSDLKNNSIPPNTYCDQDPSSLPGCHLYLDESDGYTHYSQYSKPTAFYRYFYVEQNMVNGLGGQVPDADDYQVTVVVSWNEGSVPNELRLHSELTNSYR